MNCLSQVCSFGAIIFGRTSHFIGRNTLSQFCAPSWKRNFENTGIRATDLEFLLARFRVQCYSSRSSKGKATRSRKLKPEPVMEKEDTFFVVRKGDVVGVYKSFADCQAQVGSSVCDPPVSVYKGYSLPKGTEEYLNSFGLKNALYTIKAADLKEDLFGMLMPCPIQDPAFSKGDSSSKDTSKKRLADMFELETGDALDLMSTADPLRKHAKLDHHVEVQAASSNQKSCILEFDGASKGNPGQAGAAAVLRTIDGHLICKLREGLGIATNNVAEYRAMILGMKYALKKGYTSIQVRGDSKLVCLQIQGLWKVKHEAMSELHKEAKQLKDKFLSFKISHVLRELNTEADAQANLAVKLADGQIQEEL
ncbi:hypothetical protein SLE2022_202660 [Rubroshorea leprosula]